MPIRICMTYYASKFSNIFPCTQYGPFYWPPVPLPPPVILQDQYMGHRKLNLYCTKTFSLLRQHHTLKQAAELHGPAFCYSSEGDTGALDFGMPYSKKESENIILPANKSYSYQFQTQGVMT